VVVGGGVALPLESPRRVVPAGRKEEGKREARLAEEGACPCISTRGGKEKGGGRGPGQGDRRSFPSAREKIRFFSLWEKRRGERKKEQQGNEGRGGTFFTMVKKRRRASWPSQYFDRIKRGERERRLVERRQGRGTAACHRYTLL